MARHDLGRDLTHALRALRRAPGYAALVVGTLAFGVAANTVVFSAMNPYLLRPLPYARPEELVQVNVVNPVTGWDMDRLSVPQYEDWKARQRSFAALGAYNYGVANVTGPEGPERVQLSRVTTDLFPLLGVAPALGRGFAPEEGRPGAEPVVIMAESLWRRRYGGDPTILGRAVTLDGVQHTVVGVMPASFVFPFGSARLWLPLTEDLTASRAGNNLILVGRLAQGSTRESAAAELDGIHRELAALHVDTDGRMSGVTVKPLREALNFAWDVLSVAFRVLLAAMAFVLLIACVNVASLTLARGSARAREIAVRAALGAGRGRIVRQLMVESLALALTGGALGAALSWWLAGLMSPVLPEDLYRVGEIDIDGQVLAFTLVVTLATPVAFGLLPALRASRVDLAEALKQGGRASPDLATSRGRQALVVAQVALAVALVAGAGLMLRSFFAVRALDLGFDADRVVTAEVALPVHEYPTGGERAAWVDRAVQEVARLPGVTAASAATWIPLNHELFTVQAEPPERSATPVAEWPVTAVQAVTPGYFATVGIDLLEGRDLAPADGSGAPPVVVVGRTLARRFWPDGDAVGKTLLAGDDPARPETWTVIGVVGDVRLGDLAGDDAPLQMYRPVRQGNARRFFVLARTGGTPASLVAEVREALREVDPDLSVEVRPLGAVVRENHLQWSIGSVFLGAFGAGAVLLAALGIYGLISYSVSRRRAEMGVRLALGATRGDIRRRVLGEGLRLTGLGLALGIVGSLALGRLASSALYGVSPFDPLTLGSVVLLFAGVAASASVVPAERACRTDPVGPLRSE